MTMLSREHIYPSVLCNYLYRHSRLVRTFGDDIISKTVVYDLFIKFKAERLEVKDQQHSGRPSASDEDKLRQ